MRLVTSAMPAWLSPNLKPTRTIAVALPVTTATVIALLATPSHLTAVAAPALAIVNIAVWSLVLLWNRDDELPLFEAGTMCIGFTVLYTAYPLIAFVLAGGLWTEASDNRLLDWAPDAHELGSYAWRCVAYTAAFAVVYLAVRGRTTAANITMRGPSRADSIVMVWLFLLLASYFAGLWVWFGVTYNPSYTDAELGHVRLARDLPYVLQQISHNAQGVLTILKLCAIALLMGRWSVPKARGILVAWLSVEVLATVFRMGARTETVVLLLAAVLLYHRMVRPLQLRMVALAVAALLAGALAFGFARDFMRRAPTAVAGSYWATANEFQILMGTGYDLHMRHNTGALEPIPWQVYAADALRIVPSQLLDVAKIDPSDWYLQQLGIHGQGVGLMFGVMAQAAIGFGTVELIARGALLGLVFALAHRAYARRARGFWVSMLYLYLCLWSYYTIRASSFYFVYVMLYRFLPTMLFVIVAAEVIRRAARPRALELHSESAG